MKISFIPRGRLRRRLLVGACALGALLTAALGWLLGYHWLGGAGEEALTKLSFDLAFIFRGPVERPPACIVYLDERSAAALAQRGGVWDRRVHTRLVRRLSAEGARAVFLDIVFADPSVDPAVDEDFAAAMKENGRVFIGAGLELEDGLGAAQERTVPPTPVLRRAAAGWGLLAFRPLDSDYGVRRLYCGTETVPSAAWRAAVKLGAPLADTAESRAKPRWVNYYGPPDSFENISYDRALDPEGTAPGYFRDRLVFVGERSTLGVLKLGKDDFRTPYGVVDSQFSKGVEIHLTSFLNLLRGEWLRRIPARTEWWIVLFFGVALGGGLPLLRPHFAALVAVLAALVVGIGAVWLLGHRQWFAWCVPTLVQAPFALAWAVSTRYFIEERRRNALRDAFSHYLSPQMADRIADADFDLRPGGVLVEATVMFSDLENFTSLSEELRDPELVARVLTTYFTHTTGHILESDGTIVKYLGDSVQAVWGAPLPDRDHARKAAAAAWKLYQSSLIECDGRILRTRIGVHTGTMLSGNLGSAQRFDYAVTGDAVNFASRLEGLNKFLGTNVLISDALRQAIGGDFVARCAGEFRVVGKKLAVVIHELLGPAPAPEPMPWLEAFARALDAFRHGDLDAAEAGMRETIVLRGGCDGPAEFYLAQIAVLRAHGLPSDWTGVVTLTSK